MSSKVWAKDTFLLTIILSSIGMSVTNHYDAVQRSRLVG